VTSAERVQIDLMRAAGGPARAALALRLSDETIALTRRAIARAEPHLDAQARALRFVELQYGSELAVRVRAFLASRKLET